VSAPMLDSRDPAAISPEEVLARLERYVAEHRPPSPSSAPSSPFVPGEAATETFLPDARRPHRRLATIDLFPYDLVASIAGCAATIMAYVSFGRPVAFAVTGALAATGELVRRRRWFPSLGVNLVVGTLAGLLFVFTA